MLSGKAIKWHLSRVLMERKTWNPPVYFDFHKKDQSESGLCLQPQRKPNGCSILPNRRKIYSREPACAAGNGKTEGIPKSVLKNQKAFAHRCAPAHENPKQKVSKNRKPDIPWFYLSGWPAKLFVAVSRLESPISDPLQIRIKNTHTILYLTKRGSQHTPSTMYYKACTERRKL